VYDGDDRITTMTAGSAVTTFTHDAYGRMTGRSGATTETYGWDARSELATVASSEGTVTYQYYAAGLPARRQSSVSGDATDTAYFWSGGKLAASESADGTLMRYIYGPGGMPLQLIDTKPGGSPTPYWYHLEPLGNVVAITDAEGWTTASYDYDPWGKATSTGAYQYDLAISRANPLRYRGYFYDAELELYVLPARVYDPALKRFLSVDPDASTALSPLEMNRYAYCSGGPVNSHDPSGAMADYVGDGKRSVINAKENAARHTSNKKWKSKWSAQAEDAYEEEVARAAKVKKLKDEAKHAALRAGLARGQANAIAAAEQRAANARMMKTANMVGGIGSGVELVGASLFGLGAALDATVVGVGPGIALNVIGGVLVAGSIACQLWAFRHARNAGATREVAFGTAVTEYQVVLRLRESKSLNGLGER